MKIFCDEIMVLGEIPAYAGMTGYFSVGMMGYLNAGMMECLCIELTEDLWC